MFQVGDILADRYQLQQKLGRTAMGRQTWLAIDHTVQEKVTIKLLAFNPQLSWEELKLFEREAEVLGSLEHPRIPRYRAYFDIDRHLGGGVPWFVLVQDYIPGFSLQDLLDQGQHFTEIEIRSLATEILEILIYLHELSPPVLHRDIKPSNLILGEDEHIYLVDFGAVQAQAGVTGVTFTVVGSSGYSPLEQFWGKAVPASDLYALGATLIHLLTGCSPADLPHKDAKIKFSDKVSLKKDLIIWLEKLTEITVDRRFKSARDALECLQSGTISNRLVYKGLNFRKLKQPTYSKIHLEQSEKSLKIKFPPKLKILPSSKLMFFSFLTSIFIFNINPILLIILGGILASLVKKSKIEFDELKFKIIYSIFDLIIWKKEAYNNQIAGIFIYNNSNRDYYQIKIRTSDDYYLLGGSLTESECTWIVQEIKAWLTSVEDLDNM
ncbi:serine/threonine protein kinase [Aphanothece hegewaldii CCALA 016]|uniref:Serine/threonine protein kinase n=1 Tax=Aphanothece hegewaldii CCALA 016 TaxID=2107694 RepID=A0A2T1LTX9_9CHRO|nr:serine/threonine-protein kinase [Aphanothece hegewaldii]PSF34577.1 serine/threonine protein kinase [Aphanothece hegewaldii CCALA 016]